MPPKPPHHHPLPKPPKRKGDTGRLWASFIVGSGLAIFVAAVMYAFAVPLAGILLTCAPIWIGSIMLAYTVQRD